MVITSSGRSSLERRMRDWQAQLRVPHREVPRAALVPGWHSQGSRARPCCLPPWIAVPHSL